MPAFIEGVLWARLWSSDTQVRHVSWGFPPSGEETKPYTDEVTSIAGPGMVGPGLDHMASN